MKTRAVLATLVLCSSFYSIAQTADNTSAEILNRLDMTSFPNSLGPRHLKQGTTLTELKNTTVSSEKGMATATNADKSWIYALKVLDEDKQGVLRRNRRNFRYLSLSPATSVSRSINSLLLWKV